MFTDNPSMVREMTATQFLFVQSGTYQPQFNRHFDTSVSTREMGNLQRAMDENVSTTINAGLISNYAPNLLSIRQDLRSQVQLPNGWGSSRGIFLLQFRVKKTSGAIEDYTVQGYTDYNDPSHTGILDPRMTCYINNVVITSPMQVQHMGITQESHRFMSAFQPVIDHAGLMNPAAPSYGHLMRPRDMAMKVSNLGMVDGQFSQVENPSSHLTNGLLVPSSKSNNVATTYLTTLFKNFANSVAMPTQTQDGESNSVASFADATLPFLRESGQSDVFLRKLASVAQMGGSGTAVCSFGDLRTMFPNLDQVGVRLEQQGGLTSFKHAGVSEHWQGNGLDTKIAIQLATSVPAMLLENMAHTAVFQISNLSGVPQVFIRQFQTISPSPHIQQVKAQEFEAALRMNLLNQITNSNATVVDALVSVMIFGEVNIQLSVEGYPPTTFVAPCFCDSLLTPVYTPHKDVADTFLSSIQSCLSDIVEGVNSVVGQKALHTSQNILAAAATPVKHFEGAFAVPSGFVAHNNGGVPFTAQPTAPVQSTGGSALDQIFHGQASPVPVQQVQPRQGGSALDDIFNR